MRERRRYQLLGNPLWIARHLSLDARRGNRERYCRRPSNRWLLRGGRLDAARRVSEPLARAHLTGPPRDRPGRRLLRIGADLRPRQRRREERLLQSVAERRGHLVPVE